MTTLGELIAALQDLEDDFGESEVRLMTQQSYPFENGIYGVAVSGDIPVDSDDDPPESFDPEVVYIIEGQQIKYGNKDAWEVARRL